MIYLQRKSVFKIHPSQLQVKSIMTGTPREPLTPPRVLSAALALVDRDGVAALSMRRLGRELGVEAMSLYNHVANKDEILAGLVDLVLADIDVPSAGDEWRDAMRRRAASTRSVFLRHPWAIGLLETYYKQSSPRRLGYFDGVLGCLRAAGFSNQLAMRGFTVLDAYIYGFIIQELSLAFDDDESLREVGADLLLQMAERYPHLSAVTREVMAEGYDRVEEFHFGLELILDGLDRARSRA